jgi:hypothetical protein
MEIFVPGLLRHLLGRLGQNAEGGPQDPMGEAEGASF